MIYMELKGLPISTNAAYMTIPKRTGKKTIPLRVLTPEGRAYKTETKAYFAQKYPTELKIFVPDKPFGIHIQLLVANLQNKGWPQKADTRYKRLDASNRVKLLEDVLVEASGVDDSQFLTVAITKAQAGEQGEMTRIWVWEMEDA